MATSLTEYMTGSMMPDISSRKLGLGDVLAKPENASGGHLDFLNFTGKIGVYQHGVNKEDIDDEDLWVLLPHSLSNGWRCWKNSEVVGQHDWYVSKTDDDQVFEDDLVDHGPYQKTGDGWKRSWSFLLINGQGPSEKMTAFSTTTDSAKKSVVELVKEVDRRAEDGEPFWPLMMMKREKFLARGDWNWKPTFHPVTWVTVEAVLAYQDGAMTINQLAAGEEPKKKAKRPAKKGRK